VVARKNEISNEDLAFAQLQASEARYRAVVNSQTEFIVRWKDNGIRTFVNEAYCRCFGQTEEELLGTSFFDQIPKEQWEVVRAKVAKLTPENPVGTDEHQVLLPEGGIGWQEWTDVAIFDEGGELVEYQSVGRDINERKMREEELERAYEEIQTLKEQLLQENVVLRKEIRQINTFKGITGDSPTMRQVMALAEQVAPTASTVLIRGETGSGKEMIARAIHEMSGRSNRPMIVVNCAAIPDELIESELFGREKGAFTGADKAQAGRFELADGGTIFLDEIGELSPAAQAKLLRVLQEGQFERLGSGKSTKVNVRVLAATHRSLEEMVRERKFREDLFYRLNVFPILVPALREHPEDIPELVQLFVHEFSESIGRRIECISAESLERLMNDPWPGNIRELRNVVERAMILARGPTLEIDPPQRESSSITNSEPASGSQSQTLEEVEKAHIESVLKTVGWKVRGQGGAAQILDLAPTTLESRMKKLGIKRPE